MRRELGREVSRLGTRRRGAVEELRDQSREEWHSWVASTVEVMAAGGGGKGGKGESSRKLGGAVRPESNQWAGVGRKFFAFVTDADGVGRQSGRTHIAAA